MTRGTSPESEARAEARTKKAEAQARESAAVWAERRDREAAVAANTVRLKELRLAKEQAERDAADRAVKPAPAAKRSRAAKKSAP